MIFVSFCRMEKNPSTVFADAVESSLFQSRPFDAFSAKSFAVV